MENVILPYSDPGKASFEQLDTWFAKSLLSGTWPPFVTGLPQPVTANLVLQQFAVVGLDDGALVMATYNIDPDLAIKPIGLVPHAVVGAADGSTTAPIIYSGCFDPDALVWDASFDTAGKKVNAFVGSPTPTQIVIRPRG